MTQQELAQLYSNYCAIYGDLMLKKEQLDKDLLAIRKKINDLQKQSQTTESYNEQDANKTKNS
jgi:hypothetical protein